MHLVKAIFCRGTKNVCICQALITKTLYLFGLYFWFCCNRAAVMNLDTFHYYTKPTPKPRAIRGEEAISWANRHSYHPCLQMTCHATWSPWWDKHWNRKIWNPPTLQTSMNQTQQNIYNAEKVDSEWPRQSVHRLSTVFRRLWTASECRGLGLWNSWRRKWDVVYILVKQGVDMPHGLLISWQAFRIPDGMNATISIKATTSVYLPQHS